MREAETRLGELVKPILAATGKLQAQAQTLNHGVVKLAREAVMHQFKGLSSGPSLPPSGWEYDETGEPCQVVYTLPADLAEKLSEEEREFFDSLTEDQKRLLLKQSGHIPSVSTTATYSLAFARIGLNRRAARESRTDVLQELIMSITKEDPTMTWRDVVARMKKYDKKGVIETISDDTIEWVDKNGKVKDTPISAIEDRVRRAKKNLKPR